MAGPLSGIKVIEVAGLGAAPFCGMMLADFGAEVIRIDRTPGHQGDDPGATKSSFVDRGRRSIALDLKSEEGVSALLQLVKKSDVFFEAFRPGVAERLGFGPETCLALNERLVYGRMTGWGQSGPLSKSAGHDINYISISGALHSIGHQNGPPVPPLNLVGDYGGGGLLLAFGIVSAVLETTRTGKGQVVDAAMSDGAILLMTEIFSQYAEGTWSNQREDNLLDGGAPFYSIYECADGKYISVGSIEAKFFQLLLTKCEFDGISSDDQWNKLRWPEMRRVFTNRFKTKTRDEWCQLLEGVDACFAPVLDFEEAPEHPHNIHRNAFISHNGKNMPSPAPRFSSHPEMEQKTTNGIGDSTKEILHEIGYSVNQIADMLDSGMAFQK